MLVANPKAPLLMLAILSIALPAAIAQPVGWRTDATGEYPDANPTVEWATDQNVIWAAPMPSWSNATPVIVGDLMFICSEPSTLMCVGITDGEILWQRTNDLTELVDADEAAKVTQAQKDGAALRAEKNKAEREGWKLRRELQDKPDDADLKAKVEAKTKEVRALRSRLVPYEQAWYGLPDVHGTNGFTSHTPVCDGENVYVVFGTGLVAAYSLDGELLWRRVVEKATIGYGPCTSPALAGGKLLVHLKSLIALDPATGETLWQTRVPEGFGSPVIARVGDTDVVVTPKGNLVRVEDGAILAKSLANLAYCAPVLEGDVAYYIQHGGSAVQFPEQVVDDALATEKLWDTVPRKTRYYASPVVLDGLIYACGMGSELHVIDADTGEIIYEQRLNLRDTCYPSVTLAGDLLFVSSDNGTTAVVKTGREFEEVARNKLETFRSSPVFIGDRMYIRAYNNLYCIGEVEGG